MKYIAYYRVSTKKQGLGLEAQQASVLNYIKAQEGRELLAEYSEKESGKDNNRPQLAAALAECKKQGACLLIAKLDRLSRKVSFIFSLRDSGAEFCAIDLPEFTPLTLAIFAGMAQQERELISSRTSAALQALKAKGVKLGAPNATFSEAQRSAALEVRRAASKDNACNRRAYALVKAAAGLGWKALAQQLNDSGFTTAKGGSWSAVQVQRLVKLYEA